jgi:hypothetical protein
MHQQDCLLQQLCSSSHEKQKREWYTTCWSSHGTAHSSEILCHQTILIRFIILWRRSFEGNGFRYYWIFGLRYPSSSHLESVTICGSHISCDLPSTTTVGINGDPQVVIPQQALSCTISTLLSAAPLHKTQVHTITRPSRALCLYNSQ